MSGSFPLKTVCTVEVVFIFSSKMRVLVWCGLKLAENEGKTTHVSDQHLSLGEYVRFQKWAFSACFQAENDPFINSGTGEGEQSTDKGKQYRVLTKINSVTSGQAGGVFRQLFLQCR
jgi:hypothetical protein